MHTIQGLAYEVKEKSLSEKVEVSSLVFIGTITDPNYRPLSVGSHERVALVRVDKVRKGSASSTVQVRYATGSPESDLACCKVGERYLFFVSSNTLGVLESVNGRFGAYRIDDAAFAPLQ
jgi:hypothetical protein